MREKAIDYEKIAKALQVQPDVLRKMFRRTIKALAELQKQEPTAEKIKRIENIADEIRHWREGYMRLRKELDTLAAENKRLREIIIDTITHCTGQCDTCHNRLDLALTDEDRENAFRKKQALNPKKDEG